MRSERSSSLSVKTQASNTCCGNLGQKAHVYVGTGLGSLDTIYQASVKLYQAQNAWDAFWAGRCADLEAYLAELSEIDSTSIHEGDVETAKLHLIREKEKRHARLQEKWGTPPPPWSVTSDLLWNIHNTAAAQISILGGITGLSFAPVAACSTFGVALGLAMRAIKSGDAKVVVVGATDPPPHPLTVGSFYSASGTPRQAESSSVPLDGFCKGRTSREVPWSGS